MKFVLFMLVYLGGGLALYPYLDALHPVGVSFKDFYSWFSLDLGVDLWLRLGVSFTYASIFYLVWASFFSESSEKWIPTIRPKDILYLFLRVVGYCVLGVFVVGLVGFTSRKVPHGEFHQYFKFLMLCMLVGVWSWSIKDFFVAVINYPRSK